jgi:deazaflavin-dependent oxidoreductase (nitroreductase family)
MPRMNLISRLFIKAHVWMYRSSDGKRGATIGGMPVLLLTTHGRKSGAQRTVPVVPYIEGEETYVIASMAGQPRSPAWYFNLEKDPRVEVQFGKSHWKARAEILPPEQREAIWPRITARYSSFAEYQKKTTRVIPVVKLVRAA